MKAALMIVGFLFLAAALFVFNAEAGTEDDWNEEGARSGAYGSIVLALEGVGFMVAAAAITPRQPAAHPQHQPMMQGGGPMPTHPGTAPSQAGPVGPPPPPPGPGQPLR